MSFKANDSNAGFVKTWYTGKENVKVTHINPSTEELTAMGFKMENPVEYTSNKDGKDQVRIAVCVENGEGFKTTLNFYLVNEQVVTKSGDKVQFINKFGQAAYLPVSGEIPQKMQWYNTDGMREAVKGEEEFLQFLVSYLNTSTKKGDTCQIENISKLFKGDFSEIKGIPTVAGNNKVGILFGVKKTQDGEGKDKYVQTAYTRLFLRQFVKTTEKLHESVESFKSNGGGANVNYGTFPYNFTQVDPAKLAWEQADSPADLVGTTPAF